MKLAHLRSYGYGDSFRERSRRTRSRSPLCGAGTALPPEAEPAWPLASRQTWVKMPAEHIHNTVLSAPLVEQELNKLRHIKLPSMIKTTIKTLYYHRTA